MKHLRLLASVFALAIATYAAKAAVGGTFNMVGLTYTVLTEDTNTATGTVSVKDRWKAPGVVEIPESVTYNDITYVVTKLANNAFQDCTGITSVTLPSTITAIPTYCFSGCTKLATIDIPSTVKSYGTNAFQNCKALLSITIPSMTTIPEYCFYGCSSLTNISLPSTLTSIGAGAFEGCSSLTSIILPTTLTSIGVRAFKDCSSLATFTNLNNILTKLKKIADWTFSNTAIETVELPSTLTTIGKNAYFKCKMTSIIGLESTKITSLGQEAFAECPNLSSNIKFPTTLKSTGVGVFRDCPLITSIDLSGSITTVNYNAFKNCTSLQNLIIPANVKEIGMGAFYGCTALTSITIPATLTRCGSHYITHRGTDTESYGAFEKCSNLKDITIEEGVTALGARCFAYTGVEEITIPSSMTHLGYLMTDEEINAAKDEWNKGDDGMTGGGNTFQGYGQGHSFDNGLFMGCYNLKKVNFPENSPLTSIGNRCFRDCTSLDTLDIPANVKYIGNDAFAGTQFEYIKLPDGLEIISDGAFSRCDKLRLIKIPNSVKYMRAPVNYYSYEDGLAHKEWVYTTTEEEVRSLHGDISLNGGPGGNIFNENKAQTHVTLPSWLETVGGVIYNCEKVTEITIPAYIIRGRDLMYSSTPLNAVYFMGDSIPKGFEQTGMQNPAVAQNHQVTFYVKKSVYENRYPQGFISGSAKYWWSHQKLVDYYFPISYKVPFTMANASGSPLMYKTMCRDFDVDLTHTNDNLPEGVEPLRAYLVDDVEGDLRMVFLNEIKYIPSRLKANTTDEQGNRYQGVDEYVGVILRGTPGYTYYYEIGEHDYTQGAEGQWLMEDAMQYSNSYFNQNLMAGDANDDFYVYKTVKDEDNNDIVNYGLNSNKLKIYYKDGWLGYNKSYLQLSKDVSDAIERNTDAEGNANLTFIFNNADGSTDKVSSVEFNRNSESDIFYNPYGQRVNADTKGIVINNGKKYVNK